MITELLENKLSITKQPYQTPRLVCYGAVRDLTQAGTGVDIENGNPGNCSQTPTRKPCV